MAYKENLKKAKTLKEELDSLRPLTPEMEKRIMQKFRLDWNYHSSHIEGNTLTYGETKALILFGQTAQAKPLKDHLEMSGHDEAIKNIEEVIKQKRPLTESFIREIHIIILKEPYEVDAITPDGKPTKKTIKIGQYKTTANHVKTQTGEIYYFASPEETPAKMEELMKWYADNLNKKKTDPVLFATEFHYRFIRIHPFDDGNGRIARLLMNFILMQFGYPPVIIKTDDKQNYFNALQQADAGQLEYFFNYISEQVIHSLELMIKGAKGEEIEEPDDFDKKLNLLKQEIESTENEEYGEERNTENINIFINKLVIPLFSTLFKRMSELDSLFNSSKRYVLLDNENKLLTSSDFSFLKVNWKDEILKGKELCLLFVYNEFVKARPKIINKSLSVDFNLEKYYYELKEVESETYIKSSYDTFLDNKAIESLALKISSKFLDEIKLEWDRIREERNTRNK